MSSVGPEPLRVPASTAGHGGRLPQTPSGFYSRDDAERARTSARETVEAVEPYVPGEA